MTEDIFQLDDYQRLNSNANNSRLNLITCNRGIARCQRSRATKRDAARNHFGVIQNTTAPLECTEPRSFVRVPAACHPPATATCPHPQAFIHGAGVCGSWEASQRESQRRVIGKKREYHSITQKGAPKRMTRAPTRWRAGALACFLSFATPRAPKPSWI